MKKILIVIFLFLLAGGGYFGYQKFKPTQVEEEEKKVINRKETLVNQLDLEKRPYVVLRPREDGRELSLTISNLKMGEKRVEYELEYQAGTMIQGAFGRIDFEEEPAPVTKKLLLGSCSKGKCTYDKDVSGGSLTLYFEGREDYSLKGDFTLNQMEEKEGIFSSRDLKASLGVGTGQLGTNDFVVVFSTMGLPDKVDGQVLAGPVGFFGANKSVSEGILTFKTDETEGVKVLGWDGEEWKSYPVEAEDGSVFAEIDRLGSYVLVSK